LESALPETRAQTLWNEYFQNIGLKMTLFTSLAQRLIFHEDERTVMVFSKAAEGAMPEIGLLPFAHVAMDVATATLPTYRSRFSKHQFTQPQLLAILCLMRYENWTFREAEVRLREHAELRAVLRLSSVPDYTTVCRFLRRLPDDAIESALGESVRRLRRSSRRGRRRACVAVDGTGLAQHAVSTYFIRRVEQPAGGKTRYRHFLKWLIVVDVDRQIILAQRARQGPWCDTRALPGLVDAASRTMPIGVVLADAEFDSEANHRHVRGTLGAHSVIPPNPRRGIPEAEFRHQMHRAFPRQLYGPRAKIETVFSVIKRKLSAKAPGRSLPMQMRQALLLGLAFNLYRLRHRPAPAGCKQSHLKFFRMNTCGKTGEGGPYCCATSKSQSPAAIIRNGRDGTRNRSTRCDSCERIARVAGDK
jgi:Transposase DDE domain/Transposase domain (DUF772)